MKRSLLHRKNRAVLFVCLLFALLLPVAAAFTVSASAASSGAAVSAGSIAPAGTGTSSGILLDSSGRPFKPSSDDDGTKQRPDGNFMGMPFNVRESANLPTYLIITYLIGIVIPVIGIIALLRAYSTRESAMLIVADVICLFYNAIYFQHLNSSSISEAIMTLKMSLLCSMAFCLFFMMFLASYMSAARMRGPITFYGVLTVTMVAILWDNRYSALVYDNMSFAAATGKAGSYSSISFDEGILYLVNNVTAFIILLLLFAFTIRLYRKNTLAKIKRNLRSVMAAELIIAVSIPIAMSFGILYDYQPILASVSVLALTINILRGDFFGTINKARNSVFEQIDDGFITVDTDYHYLDSNRYARELFPALQTMQIGSVLPEDILHEFHNDASHPDPKNFGNPEKSPREINGRYFRSFVTPLAALSEDEVDICISDLQIQTIGKMDKATDFVKRHRIIGTLLLPLIIIIDILRGEHLGRRIAKIQKDSKKITGYSLLLVDITTQRNLLLEAREERQKALEAAKSKSDFLSNMSHEIRTPMNAIVGMTEIMMREDLPNETLGYLTNIKNSGAALLSIINDILDFSKIESGKLEIIEDNYEPMSMLSDLSMIFLNRIGEKPVELLYDIDPALPKTLYGDNIRVRQVITNIANNAIKFTDEGYVRLSMKVENNVNSEDPTALRLTFAIEDTGQGIKEEDLGKLFGSFSQVDTKKNRKKEGTGLGLAISKNLVERMGGHITVTSIYGEGSVFKFDIIQHGVTEEAAAEVRGENGKQTVSGVFASANTAHDFDVLCRQYDITQIPFDDVIAGRTVPDMVFCDSTTHAKYDSVFDTGTGAAAIRHVILKNPMTEETDSREFSLNKPLYSLNFCQVLNHDTVTAFETHAETIDFIAPDAKILVVDDNDMNLKVAKGLLAPLQMTIDTATSGKEALELITDGSYDIIFMDHMMPEMDGVECTKHIRERESDYMKTVPIIALTANAVAGAKDEFLAAGMDDFVPKPIEMTTICKKIKAFLPREKVKKQKVDLNAGFDEAAADFPDLPGIDINEGIKNSGSPDMFREFLGDYYRLIDMKAQKIRDCLNDGLIKDYTIEVHALKSTSRTIGAMGLGDKFYRLEQLGDENNVEAIQAETPAVLAEYEGMKEELARFAADDNSDKREASKEEILDLLETVKTTADDFDLDGTDAAMKELAGIRLSDALAPHFTKLQALVADVATDDIMAEVDEMKEIIHNE